VVKEPHPRLGHKVLPFGHGAPNPEGRVSWGEIFILGTLVLASVGLAWQGRFIQDDAFISFRYARNLADGQGLVWNPGERVEGYTNFLWVLLMTIPHVLGVDVVAASQVAGIVLLICCLLLTWRLVKDTRGGQWAALLTVLLLGTNYSFFRWAVGGMETALQATLGVACAWLAVRRIGRRDWTAVELSTLSLLAALAVLTRPDSVLIVGPTLALVGLLILTGVADVRAKLWRMVPLVAPFGILVGGWLVWRFSYYGDWLPNTYYVKVASYTRRRWGLSYLGQFLTSYLLIPFPVLGIAGLPRLLRTRDIGHLLLVGILGLWAAYLVQIGGDFLEFRLIAPVLPFAFVMIVWLLRTLVGAWEGQAAMATLVVLGSVYHVLTFVPPAPTGGVESIRELETHLEPDQGWDDLGRALRASFPQPSRVLIAANPVGAIGYYSELDTLDMLGLNDKWIARHGTIVPIPGHQRRATLSYLLERRTNLVFGVPWVVTSGELLETSTFGPEDVAVFLGGGHMDTSIPQGTLVLRIPLGTGKDALAWYLTPSAEVDEVIRDSGWETYPVENDETFTSGRVAGPGAPTPARGSLAQSPAIWITTGSRTGCAASGGS
jgi:arabinofuranosyltransferase